MMRHTNMGATSPFTDYGADFVGPPAPETQETLFEDKAIRDRFAGIKTALLTGGLVLGLAAAVIAVARMERKR